MGPACTRHIVRDNGGEELWTDPIAFLYVWWGPMLQCTLAMACVGCALAADA